jgi:glycosyltransferase involved in cell wall biosynthesis
VHNTFPAASPSVYSAAAAARIPVVQTVHNYRFVCPAATAFRDGHACTDCVRMLVPLPAVVHACVRGSRSQSAVATATAAVHRALGTYRDRIALYLALTSFQRALLVAGGFPADRIRVVPNFLEPDPGLGTGARDGVLYVGRLSVEKGIQPLLAAAALAPGLVRVVGDGPLAQAAQAAATAGHIHYAGLLPQPEVHEEMTRAVAVILPSIWFEGFPLVVGEAFAAGTPVIASRIGSLAEMIDDGVTGLLVEPNNPRALADRLRWAHRHPDDMRRMGDAARQRYLDRYRGPSHLVELLNAYAAASQDRVAWRS